MRIKFCPNCKRNEYVALMDGKLCCSECGLDELRMSPPVTEDYSDIRPPSQSQTSISADTLTSKDYSEMRPSSQSQTSTGTGDSSSASDSEDDEDVDIHPQFWRITSMIAIIASLVILYHSSFDLTAIWRYDDGTEIVATVYDAFTMQGFGWLVILLNVALVCMALIRPQYMFVGYIAIGFIYNEGAKYVMGDFDQGFFAFLISLYILFAVCVWEGDQYPGGIESGFTKKFWLTWHK